MQCIQSNITVLRGFNFCSLAGRPGSQFQPRRLSNSSNSPLFMVPTASRSRRHIAMSRHMVVAMRCAASGSEWCTAVPVLSDATMSLTSPLRNTLQHIKHGLMPDAPLHPTKR